MGYRHKIGILSKEKHNKIKDLSLEELRAWYHGNKEMDEDEYSYVPCYSIVEEIFELGKYVDDSYLNDFRSPIFSNKELDDYYQEENDFYFINQNGFQAIIEHYKDKVVTMYKDMLDPKEDDIILGRTATPEKFFKQKILEWQNYPPYSLHLNRSTIVTSWVYEYSVFELVRIYKSIDWDKNYCTITAW